MKFASKSQAMAGRIIKWRWYLLSNRESFIIIMLYAMYALRYETSIRSIVIMNKAVVLLIFVPTIIIYCLLGLVGEIFIGTQRLLNFSMWVQWTAMIISALVTALKFSYDFPRWQEILLITVPSVVQFIGLSAFQVTAVQFGIDQIQGAPSKHLSAFIYWYFCMELLPKRVFRLVVNLLSNYAHVTELTIHLGGCILCAVLLSFVLCMKGCSMSSLFLGDPEGEKCCSTSSIRNQSNKHIYNPYSLVYRVIKFAFKHKHPIQRSALTFWEDKLPSRIDLGKNKYGGPFTSEEVENVKTFLQLIKVLVSLLGTFIVSFSVDIDTYHRIVLRSSSLVLTEVIYDLVCAGVFFLLFLLLFLPCCHKCLPGMLKRIWIGTLFTTASALSMLLIVSIGSEYSNELSCTVTLNLHLILIPMILEAGSYIVLIISLFEFLIAQSPQSMKGMLIGLYYTFRFGLAGLFNLVEYHAFETKYPTHNSILSCATTHYLEITVIGLLSLFIYTVVACKYKLRERDEVINVHIFAEEYYTKS